MKPPRRTINSRNKGYSVRGVTIKSRVSTTPNSIMSKSEIQHQWHRARHIRKISHQLDVTTMLTSVFNHLLCFNLMCRAKKVSNLINHPVVWFLAPEWVVHVLRWSPRGSNSNFLQPQVSRDFSAITGIWASMEAEKKVCQRLADQVSSLRWDLIWPSQLMVLKKRIHLGVSSSWDSRPAISVRSTESSTVTTMCWCERGLNCSSSPSLRCWKGYQWLSICWVTLCCEGMTVTSALETALLSRTKEGSMSRVLDEVFEKVFCEFWWTQRIA